VTQKSASTAMCLQTTTTSFRAHTSQRVTCLAGMPQEVVTDVGQHSVSAALVAESEEYNTERVLSASVSNDLARQFNWNGKKNKGLCLKGKCLSES